MYYSSAQIRRMVRNRGQRSKLRWAQLPEKYRLKRARNAVLGRKGAKAPRSYRERVIQGMLQNPGQRALLPDKYLTPDLLRARSTRRYLNNEVFPGAGLTGRALDTQVRRGLEMQYGDQQRADAEGLAQAQATRTRNQAWWDQYQRAVQNSQAAYNQYAQAQQAPQISTSAPTVNGQVASPTAPAASGVQAALGSIAAGRVNSNQMATAAGLASGVNVAGQRVGEQRALLDQSVQNAISQQKQTARRRALSAEDLRSKIINEAAQRFLEAQTLNQRGLIARLQAGTTRRGQDISAANNQRNNQTSRANNAANNATSTSNNQRNNRNRPSGGNRNRPRYAAAGQQAKWQGQWQQVYSAARAVARSHPTWASDRIGRYLARKGVFVNGRQVFPPSVLYAAAAEMARDRWVHPRTVRRMHAVGIKVNPLGVRTTRPLPRRG